MNISSVILGIRSAKDRKVVRWLITYTKTMINLGELTRSIESIASCFSAVHFIRFKNNSLKRSRQNQIYQIFHIYKN